MDAANGTNAIRDNYLASTGTDSSLPIMADRGARVGAGSFVYLADDVASANHSMIPGCQNVIGGAHGVQKEYTATSDDTETIYDETGECMVGYYKDPTTGGWVLGDNIYADNDQTAASDTYLLSSSANAGGAGP